MCKNYKNRHIIYVSFKNTEKEMKLFEYVNSMENQEKSDFVKKALAHYINFVNSQDK